MWLAGSDRRKTTDLLLTRQALWCAVPNQAPQSFALEGDDVATALGQALGQALATLPAAVQPLRLWLSGHWARPFLLEPVSGVQRWAEWQALAQGLASTQTGLAAPCAVWFAARPSTASVLAVATPQHLAAQCVQAAQGQRRRLLQMRPWWNAALNHALQSKPAAIPRTVAALDADSLTLLCGHDGRFTLAQTILPAPPVEQVPAALSRLAFARGVELGATTSLVCDPAYVAQSGAEPPFLKPVLP